MSSPPELVRLVESVAATSKYRAVSPDLVARLGAAELDKGRSWKEAVKATKNKLHQIGGAYLDRRPKYDAWRQALSSSADSPEQLLDVCRTIMANHVSTRERLPIVEAFYAQIMAKLGPISTVLDLACGFNPLSIPWMPLEPGARYYAYDIYTDLAEFLEEYFQVMDIAGQAGTMDIVEPPPLPAVDVALLLKAVPCIEQQTRLGGLPLLDSIDARHMIVSFPVLSLTGRSKGMATHYDSVFRGMISDRSWRMEAVHFETELAYVITKDPR